MRPIEDPVTVEEHGPLGGTRTTHPAYAQISVSRVQGGGVNLYGSDFRHQHYVVLRVCRSELGRTLSNDWMFGREEIAEIAMSEAQWAAFVSSFGIGGGVPCTLQSVQGEMVPGLPEPESRTSQFKGEVDKAMAECLKLITGLAETVSELDLPKRKAERLLHEVSIAKSKLRSNLPFVAEQFDEHMEGTVEKAKAEVHGYMMNAITRAGLAAIASPDQLPIAIEDQSEDDK